MFVVTELGVLCDECRESVVKVEVAAPCQLGTTVWVKPELAPGWLLTNTRQICPRCDAKLEGG
jgi:hypothetical protein